MHNGICMRLECWRVLVNKKDERILSLHAYAASGPTFSNLQVLADILALKYVARQPDLRELREKTAGQRDKQFENGVIANQYFLLYEELSRAMDSGDIGRVELTFAPWAFIFKGTGKHKYAAQMFKHIMDVHMFYPEGLKRAVRYSMLVNPSGKAGCFRATYWCVELANLQTKTIHCGEGSNHTINRILTESPLIKVYYSIFHTVERNLGLRSLTTRHGKPDMTSTFRALGMYMQKNSPYTFECGRDSEHSIPDVMDKGLQALVVVVGMDGTERENGEELGVSIDVEMADIPIDDEDIEFDIL